jgi:hypothetical protein
MKMSDMMGEADKLRAAITTWEPSKEAVERAAKEVYKMRPGDRGYIASEIARAALKKD